MFTEEFDGERILKIDHNLTKLWARVGVLFFDSRGRTTPEYMDIHS